MPVTYKEIEARLDEDLRQPYEPSDDVDLTDWATWELASYLYLNGVLIKTITESGTADGVITRTGTGYFYTWVKKAYLGTLAVSDSTHKYFWQTRRIDSGNNTVLHEGPLKIKPYTTSP